MTKNSFRVACIFALATTAALTACSPPTQKSQEQAETATVPRYLSAKLVSTDCGIVVIADPPPGYSKRLGATADKMPASIAQRQAVGADRPIAVTVAEKVAPGITLINPSSRKPFYLVNNDKEVIGEFAGDYFSFMQLLPNGNILGSSKMYSDTFRGGGGHTGCIEEYRADGSLVWRLALATDDYIHHHDVQKLANGNVLAVIWERVSTDKAIALGRNPEHVAENGELWFDGIVEVNPMTAEIVWEWSIQHHLIQDFDPSQSNYGVVADNPGRLDINAIKFNPDGSVGADWTHVNTLNYNEELDQIIFSSYYMSEVFVIDHNTTPHEAQGPAGDFLYRWGNPANYGRGDEESRKLFAQHDVHWLPQGLPGAGNIMIFNNGIEPERPYSTVVEFTPDMNADGSYNLGADGAYGPTELAWEYAPREGEEFFSWFISGAQRLSNGNTLVDHGAKARLREVTPEGDIVWEYAYDDGADGPHMLFRAYRYPEDHPAVLAIISKSAESVER